MTKEIIEIKDDYCGLTTGFEVYQYDSKYNPTLYFGPCKTTLHELFTDGYYLFCHARSKYLDKTYTTNLYVTNGDMRYKVNTIKNGDLFKPDNDLGLWVNAHRGKLEGKGSINPTEYLKTIDAKDMVFNHVRDGFVSTFGREAMFVRSVDQDTFTVSEKFSYENAIRRMQDVKKENERILEDLCETFDVSPSILEDMRKLYGKGVYKEVFGIVKDNIPPVLGEFTEGYSIVRTSDYKNDDIPIDPWTPLLAQYTENSKKKKRVMIGNYTLREYVRKELEKISS